VFFKWILLFFSTQNVLAQGTNLFNDARHRIGFVGGFGGQNLNQILSNINETDAMKIRNYLISEGINPDEIDLNVEYDYEVQFFQLQYYWAFLRKKTWGLDLLIQPQYNKTTFRHVDNIPDETNGYELGVNVGLLIRKNIFKDFLSFYAILSTGPHYVSGTPQRQSDGFIFSDNLLFGLNVKLLKNIYLDIRPGFRHISNASLTHPNGGVNNFVINGGFLLNL
jgi:hypothetical protein